MRSTRTTRLSSLCLCCCQALLAVLVSQMTELVLKKIGKHFGVDPWLESKNDYLVLNDAGRIIGRIVKRACPPNGRPWVWIITVPSFFNNHGYSATREQAMADFNARWAATTV
jgi:hypothetical protein